MVRVWITDSRFGEDRIRVVSRVSSGSTYALLSRIRAPLQTFPSSSFSLCLNARTQEYFLPSTKSNPSKAISKIPTRADQRIARVPIPLLEHTTVSSPQTPNNPMSRRCLSLQRPRRRRRGPCGAVVERWEEDQIWIYPEGLLFGLPMPIAQSPISCDKNRQTLALFFLPFARSCR